MTDSERRAVGVLFWFLVIAIACAFSLGLVQRCQISDLDKRVTTQETVRIEAVAPPEGVSP